MQNSSGGPKRRHRRSVEARLLLEAGLLILWALGLLLAARPDLPRASAAQLLALFLLSFFVLHLALIVAKSNADQYLLPVIAVLHGLGLVMLFRLRPDTALLQVRWTLFSAALAGIAVLRLKRYAALASYRYLAGVLALGLVALTLAIGETIGGARAWLQLGPVHFEPSEVGKVLLLLFLAGYLEEAREVLALPGGPTGFLGLRWPNLQYLGPVLIMWVVAMGLLVRQNDLGAALLFYGLFLGMLYIATGRRTYVGVGLLLATVGVVAAYRFVPQVKVRMVLWLNPWPYVHSQGFQVIQALYAMSAGGLTGSGLGLGHPDVVPAATTDYILAALGEELGLWGVLIVLAGFAVLISRAVVIALRAREDYGTLLAGGVATVIGLQVITICGGVLRLLPLTGITVPFLSYGGSALVTNFALVALLLLVSGGATDVH